MSQNRLTATSQNTWEIDHAITEAEAEYAQNGQLYDARETLSFLRKKYFGVPEINSDLSPKEAPPWT